MEKLENPNGTYEFCSILSEVSRTVRLSQTYKDVHSQIIWKTGANIIGPAFYFFTFWVLQEAERLKINRLYFLSRDGHIFFKIAQIINGRRNFNIDCRYLYGSRHLWLIASLDKIGDFELDWILSDWWYDLSVRSACKRIGIRPDDIGISLKSYGFDENFWEKKLNSQDKRLLRKCLLDVGVQERIVEFLKPQFDATLGYLKQEGFGDSKTFGIVDIGWKGKPQVALNKIFRRGNIRSPCGIHGFYFGITEAKEMCSGDQMSSFLFDLSKSLNRCQLRNNHLYEAFAASDQGKIKNFIQENGMYQPVLDYSLTQGVIDWGVRIQQESILSFARNFVERSSLNKLNLEEVYIVLEKLLEMFILKPTLDEANVYGGFPMDGELTESHIQEIAPVVTRKKFWSLCFNLNQFNLFWVQASLVRSNLLFERLLWKILLPLLEYGFYLVMIYKINFRTIFFKK